MIKASVARNLAENLWGRGGTTSEKVRREGAYYYNCSGHGGFIIDARTLTNSQYEAFAKYLDPIKAWEYSAADGTGKVYAVMHEHSRRGRRIPRGCVVTEFEIFVAEEDCDWCIPVLYANIGTTGMWETPEKTREYARGVFWRWHDRNNPVVIRREQVDAARRNGDPDMIISAIRVDSETTKVTTSDQKEYLVSDYKNAWDEFGYPWLSLCKNVRESD